MVKCFWFLHCYKYIRFVGRNGTVIQLTPVSLGARPADGLHDMWTSAGCFAVRPHSNIVLHHLEKLHRRGGAVRGQEVRESGPPAHRV